MSTNTDFNQAPYFDDYNEEKDFHRILFRPGVAVQTRELNQLQSILQKQVERFGNNIFKEGTIVDGCSISVDDNLAYVKLSDVQEDGQRVNVQTLYRAYVKNESNVPLKAIVKSVVKGLEATLPDLNTAYLRYINSGEDSSGNEISTFSKNETLTFYNPSEVIERIIGHNRSQGFTSVDELLFLPAVRIEFSDPNQTLSVNSQLTVSGIDFVVVEKIDDNVYRIKPDSTTGISSKLSKDFRLQNGMLVTSGALATGSITEVFGGGASAIITTDSIGAVDVITITNKGQDYKYPPYVTISSTTATVDQIDVLDLEPIQYIAKIKVPEVVDATGKGYSLAVTDGVIYQKGFFTRVEDQFIIVEKYNNKPDRKSVGFDTVENIVQYTDDSSLLDNASGTPNETAPGADRLQLTAQLIVKDTANANEENFLPIAEFIDGNLYKKRQQTVYNIIGDEMASRLYDEAGNFVIDQFRFATTDTKNNNPNKYRISIDPGKGYVNGKLVETLSNFEDEISKDIDKVDVNPFNIVSNLGQYFRVTQGIFRNQEDDRGIRPGSIVHFWSKPRNFIDQSIGSGWPFPYDLGINLGSAKIASFEVENVNYPTTVYRLYVYDIDLGLSKNIDLIKGITIHPENITNPLDSNNAGIMATVFDVISDNGQSKLYGSPNKTFANTNILGVKTVDVNSLSVSRNVPIILSPDGKITLNAPAGAVFPYAAGAVLSDNDLRNCFLILNTSSTLNIGNVTVSNVGSVVNNRYTLKFSGSTGDLNKFFDTVKPGLCLDLPASNTPGEGINGRYGPVISVDYDQREVVLYIKSGNLPLNIGQYVYPSVRSGQLHNTFPTKSSTAVLSQDRKTLTINFGVSLYLTNTEITGAIFVPNLVYENPETVISNVTVNRNKWVNVLGSNLPSTIGVSNVIRLRKVLEKTAANDSNGKDVTNGFYIENVPSNNVVRNYRINVVDIQQIDPAKYYSFNIDYLQFETGAGAKPFRTIDSYPINDSLDLASSTNTLNIIELPRIIDESGNEYDIRSVIDYRVVQKNFATPSSSTSTAPLITAEGDQDVYGVSVSNNGITSGNISTYRTRNDVFAMTEEGILGYYTSYGEDAPDVPDTSIIIATLQVPPYPSIPQIPSEFSMEFLGMGISGKSEFVINRYQIKDNTGDIEQHQVRRYTMSDISKLDRRLKDLEYYVSFTLAETIAKSRIIPSANDSKIDRAKFGFFVDTFDDNTYSDSTNPASNAITEDGLLRPSFEDVSIPLESDFDGSELTIPFDEVLSISQTVATSGPKTVTDPVIKEPEVNPSTGSVVNTEKPSNSNSNSNTNIAKTQKLIGIRQKNTNTNRNNNRQTFEEFTYFISETKGDVLFILNSYHNKIRGFVYQGQTSVGPWTLLNVTPTPIDYSLVTQNIANYPSVPLNGKPITLGALNYRDGYWIDSSHMLQFQTNPAAGQYLRFRVVKGTKYESGAEQGSFEYFLKYPIDEASVVVNSSTSTSSNNIKTSFNGIVQYLEGELAISSYRSFLENYVTLRVSGLKPNTIHRFFLNGDDRTSDCISEDTGEIGQIKTNANGVVTFTFKFGTKVLYPAIAGNSQMISYAQAVYLYELNFSDKNVQILSNDGSSLANSKLPSQNTDRIIQV